MDQYDVDWVNNFSLKSKYSLNDKGWLICSFSNNQLTFTGVFSHDNDNTLIFLVKDSDKKDDFSEVFELETIS